MKYHMEFQMYNNFFYHFGDIKIPVLRKREQMKKNNCGHTRRHML